MLEQSSKDVIIIDEQVDTDGLDTVHLTTSWGECVEQTEVDWAARFRPHKPFIKPRVKRAILPAADGSLALKQDAAMPGASRGCIRYKTHNLKRQLEYPKAEHVEGRLKPITEIELLTHDQRQEDLIDSDQFWQEEIVNSVYTTGPDDTPENFAIRA